MIKNKFFNNSLQVYSYTLLQLFSQFVIKTTDVKGFTSLYNVPVVFGNYNKYTAARAFLMRLEEENAKREELKNNGKRPRTVISTNESIPIISVTLTGITFDDNRLPLNMTNDVVRDNEKTASEDETMSYGDVIIHKQMMPVNYEFKVLFWARSMMHANQLLEQTIPYFNVNFAYPMESILARYGFLDNITVKCTTNNISFSVTDEQTEEMTENEGVFKMEFNFEVCGFMSRPYSDVQGTIDKIEVGLNNVDENKNMATITSEYVPKYLSIQEQDFIDFITSQSGYVANNGNVDILNYAIFNTEYATEG